MIAFFVPGIPVPKGSAKAFVVKGRAIVTQTNRDKQKPWASSISFSAQQEKERMKIKDLIQGPVRLNLIFYMPRPNSHFRTGKNADKLKDSAPLFHITKPDLDKLTRCVKDALTNVVWKDDSQVCDMHPQKCYSEKPGVLIEVEELKINLLNL